MNSEWINCGVMQQFDKINISLANGYMAVLLREVQISDCNAVLSLKRRIGLSVESPERWKSLWLENPAIAILGKSPVMGWVLEVDGEIVGYLGAIPGLYWYRGRTLTVSIANSFVVDIPYRSYALNLATAFMRQSGVDLLLNTTANNAVGRLFEFLRARRIPQRNYDHIQYFILKPSGFMAAMLRKYGFGPRLARFVGVPMGAALKIYLLLRPQGPRRWGGSFKIISVPFEKIGPEIDDLWARIIQKTPRLLAFRTTPIMRWHFAGATSERRMRFLYCRSGSILKGYAIVGWDDLAQCGLRRARLYDLLVEGDVPDVISGLVGAARDWAAAEGAHSLQLQGFPEGVRQQFLSWRPFTRELKSWPLYYKILDPVLENSLTGELAWYISPYDADDSFFAGDDLSLE